MSIEAMQQALKALEGVISAHGYQGGTPVEAVAALRKAIEQEEQAQPVAWMVYTQDGKSVCVTDNPADFTEQHRALPLYTSPLPRKPLTDEQIMANEVLRYHFALNGGEGPISKQGRKIIDAIEAAHGIKGQE
jgi:hypothetical protein